MHGCSSTSVLLVTAEFSSMGGVVEGEVGVAEKTSPRRAAIEKVQAEIRRESDYREKRKRELEFLENGGDPLEFFIDRNTSTVSVQSTSFTDQHPDQLLTSEAKGSFALTASPHGDSVDSSSRLGVNSCEPNSADNLMLFGAENEFSEGKRNSFHPKKSDVVLSETLSQLDGTQRTRKHGDPVGFGLPRKAYKRRNRSRPNRDGTRSSSSDVNPAFKGLVSSLASHPTTPGEVRETVTDAEIQNIPSNCNFEPESQVQGTLPNIGLPDIGETTVLASGKAVESTKDQVEGVPMDAVTSEPAVPDQNNLQSHPYAVETSLPLDSDGLETKQEMEEMPSAVECEPTGVATQVESLPNSCQINGFSNKKGEVMKNDYNENDTLRGVKGFNSEVACPQESISIDGLNDSEMFSELKNADSNGKIEDQVLVPDGVAIVEADELVKEKKETEVVDSCTIVNVESSSGGQTSESALKGEVDGQVVTGVMDAGEPIESESGQKPPDISADNLQANNENTCTVCPDSMDTSTSDLHDVVSVPLHAQTSSEPDAKLEEKIDEDSILKEAQIIEAKRKKIAELTVVTLPKQLCAKSHWDYVLEEMAWLANDFAQERVWKLAASAQISTRAALTCQLRKPETHSSMEAKKIAGNLSKSVMDFWYSAEDTNTILKKKSQKDGSLPVHAYAVRFMNYNKSNIVHQDEGPQTPDRVTDKGIHELSWEENSTDESLFYTVPGGAMKIYRNSVESQVLQFEKIGSSMQEEVDTSACDVTADIESQDNVYDEYEWDTSAYDMPMAFEGSKSSRTGQKKRKHLTHAYRGRSCEVNSDMLAMQYAENKVLAQQSVLMAKRPGGSLNVSIPTKRVRTASRRVISPFSAGTSGCVPLPTKTDASSGDTNSFQDDQSTLHGGSFLPNSMEVQSVGEYEKQLPIDSSEISKQKKKKKPKHLNAAYEPRWQVDSSYQNEQKDHLKKSHPLDINGSSGSLGQHMQKKPKTMRQSLDNSFENITPIGAAAPSPVASQVSNNPNQFIKMLGGRDRNRKPKAHKMLAGQPNSGGPWTLFEDQALVVLAHDLGPNWDLVSDAINSTMKFKCIFRKAKECKERHNFLMDRTADGVDSAEDSGSSQPYPCSLPGIPQGSARQLFQRLQGPMEEDAIKSHFEKIIMIEQRHHHRKTQDPKQLQQPHSSHAITLSIACPNGRPFNPVELCDAKDPEDIQVSSSGGFAFPNQGTVTPMHPMPGTSSMLQGSTNMSPNNNFSSAPGSLTSSGRDVRYGVPRPSLSVDEQRLQLQQYNQMMSGRNVPQPNISAPGSLPGNNHRLIPGSNGVGLACGINRNMPVSRNGYQGIGSSSIVNSGGIVSPGVPSPNMHPGVGSGQGTSMLRPRQAMHVMRPGPNQDSSSQMPADLPMQVPPGNSQGLSHFGGLSPTFQNPAASPPASYPTHQPSHPMSPQQPQVLSPHHSHIQGSASPASNSMQAYAIRLAKERRFLQLQQQQQQLQQTQFPPGSLMPHAQSPSQVPVSSPVQNSSQIQSQAGSPPVPPSPLAASSSMSSTPQHPQKQHPTPTQGVMRNAQAGTNQTSKQRQRQQQQFSPANRQHPQVRQQPQAQQPAKVAAKGVGRGNPMMHQNASIDPSLVNGVPSSPGNQSTDKGEAAKHLMQNKTLHSGTTLNAAQSTKQFASSQPSNQSIPQQKLYPGQASSSAKHQLSNSDSNSQGHVQPAAPVLSAGLQSSSLAMAGPNQQQAPPRQKVNPNQSAVKRVVQLNRRINSDPANKPQVRDFDCEQHPSCSSAEMDTMTALTQTSKSATNAVHVSPGSAYRWHASEPLSEPNALNSATNLSSLESMPSNSNEPASHVSQGPGQRPLPASLPAIRNEVSAQWQQPPSQLQLPNSPVPKSQQQQQLLPPLHTQQQEQLQAGNGNLYGRNGDHRLE